MPHNQWSTEKELTCIIGGLLSFQGFFLKIYTVMFYLFIQPLFFCTIGFMNILWFSDFCSYGNLECTYQWSLHVFFGALFPFVLPYSNLYVFLILSYYHPLGDCSFSNMRKMRGRWRRTGESRWMENDMKKVLVEFKKFSEKKQQ